MRWSIDRSEYFLIDVIRKLFFFFFFRFCFFYRFKPIKYEADVEILPKISAFFSSLVMHVHNFTAVKIYIFILNSLFAFFSLCSRRTIFTYWTNGAATLGTLLFFSFSSFLFSNFAHHRKTKEKKITRRNKESSSLGK